MSCLRPLPYEYCFDYFIIGYWPNFYFILFYRLEYFILLVHFFYFMVWSLYGYYGPQRESITPFNIINRWGFLLCDHRIFGSLSTYLHVFFHGCLRSYPSQALHDLSLRFFIFHRLCLISRWFDSCDLFI